MTSEKFCLRWNDFESNISSAFKELRDDKDFFDVTLACDDEQIQAHKVILSACSPFFRNILRRNPHQHPLLYLKGVKYTDLQSVLNFMYHGEVNVAQEELNSFLAVAEDLRVKGLTQNQSGSQSNRKSNQPATPTTIAPQPKAHSRPPDRDPAPPPAKRPFQHTAPQSNFSHHVDDDIQEVVPVKSEPKETPVVLPTPAPQPVVQQMYTSTPQQVNTQALAPADDQLMGYQDDSYEDYGQYGEDTSYEEGGMGMAQGNGNGNSKVWSSSEDVEQKIESMYGKQPDGGFACLTCGYFNRLKQNMQKHVETHIDTPGYLCNYCFKHFKTKNSLNTHTSQKHRQEKKQIILQ